MITCDDKVFDERLNELRQVMIDNGINADPNVIVRDEARKFLKVAIGLTNPNNDRAKGEKKVERDLRRIFTPAQGDFLLYEFGSSGAHVDQWFTNRQGEKVHAQFDVLDIHGNGMESTHQRARAAGRSAKQSNGNKTGNLWQARYVVSYEAFNAYAARVKARVGMRVSGWAKAYQAMGGKVPRWIARHIGKGFGRVEDGTGIAGKPYILMGNSGPGITDNERVITEAFRIRGEAIRRRIKLIVSGYNKQLKAQMRISAQAREEAD